MEKLSNQQNVAELCVAKVPFFNHLPDDEMLKVADKGRHKHFKKGDFIYRDGDEMDSIYIVHQGSVKIYQLFSTGKEQLLRILEPGDFMGELGLFTSKTLDNYAEALKNTEICVIHRNDMRDLMQEHPTIAMNILGEFSNRLDKTEKLVGQLSSKDVETRLSSYLLEQANEKNTTKIELPMSKKDLASFLGTTQETISRRLSNFQTNGWILQKGHRGIKIKNKDALHHLAYGD